VIHVIPNTWVTCKLTNLYFLPTGVKEYDGNKDYYSTGSMQSDSIISEGKFSFLEKPSRANRLVQSGDILQARMKATNKACFISQNLAGSLVSTGFMQFRPDQTILDSKYLYYYLSSPKFLDEKDNNCTGATQQSLNDDNAKKIYVPIAPFNEQKRIVEKLDTLLNSVDAIKKRLDNVPAILKRFRQSVLFAAISGKLTEEWREDNGIGEEWKNDTLENIAKYIVDCPHSTPKWSESGKYCVRTTAFNPFFLDLSEQGFVSEEVYQKRIQRLKPEAGDILYSREGAILGIACQIPEGVELCLGQRMVLIRASEKALAKYLTIILNSEKILNIVRTKIIGNAAPRINVKEIRLYQIPVPSLSEQKEIVSQVESLFTLADKLEEKIEAAKKRVDKLTQSILAKAFKGELVPQDPNDEPAEKLLEKIQKQQTTSDIQKKEKKMLHKSVPEKSCKNSNDLKSYIFSKYKNEYFSLDDLKQQNLCSFPVLMDFLFELFEKKIISSTFERHQKLYKLIEE
jgi:type I restriction enzyme, S subunit